MADETILIEIESALKKQRVDVSSLIQGIQIDNPRLYQILMGLNGGVVAIQKELFPLVIKDRVPDSPIPTLPAPLGFSYTIALQRTIRFQWSQVPEAFGYEIRQGLIWDTASFRVRTPSLFADLDPLLTGSYTFLIKTINAIGEYSDDVSTTVVEIPTIGAVTIAQEVIDNNVLLRWTIAVPTFAIRYFQVFKNTILVGVVQATFFSIFENVSGTYTYRIQAVDIVGNVGAPSDISVTVNQPPDYALQDTRTSGLNGIRVNVVRDPGLPSLVACWTDQTWQQHFVTRSWNTIQDQISAGYPIYVQPTVLTGSYEEVVDYGLLIANTIVTVTYNHIMHDPDVAVVIKMAASADNVSYTPFVAGASQFIASMRYLKFRLEFTATDDKALIEVYNLTISLSVKRENDGGEIFADYTLVTDPGTLVLFTKQFKDIESITCTVKSTTEPYYTIFDFVDIPNPTGFRVFVFDSSGNRVKKTVDWKARGII